MSNTEFLVKQHIGSPACSYIRVRNEYYTPEHQLSDTASQPLVNNADEAHYCTPSRTRCYTAAHTRSRSHTLYDTLADSCETRTLRLSDTQSKERPNSVSEPS